MSGPRQRIDRREFVARSALTAAGAVVAGGVDRTAEAAAGAGPFQALGTRVGEVTDTTAIVWTRLTASPTRNDDGVVIPKRAPGEPKRGKGESMVDVPIDELEGACPGAMGKVQLRYSSRADLADARVTDVAVAAAENDFSCTFKLEGLSPDSVYHYRSEVPGGGPETAVHGTFTTAPAADAVGEVRFCVMTCQGYADRGHPDGHAIYPAMAALEPQFACLTGDLVYYDSGDPDAVTERLARYHWERMFSLPRLVDFVSHHSTYWLKDDHDTLSNDSGPGAAMGDFTFAQGQAIFLQQAPLDRDGPSYRTFRWGRDLQVWFTDGRDFRSRNKLADGPGKTIWGAEQMAWFQRTVTASDATWKVLVSPTPLVGPDRKGKRDNHANEGFTHEGDEIRAWLKANVPDNFFAVCGDRHWQYHSVHPQTGLHEFSAGPASDEHASGSPGLDPRYHRFHRVQGGFLAVRTGRDGGKSRIVFEHRDVRGGVAHSYTAERAV